MTIFGAILFKKVVFRGIMKKTAGFLFLVSSGIVVASPTAQPINSLLALD